jgi:hypothetical protein
MNNFIGGKSSGFRANSLALREIELARNSNPQVQVTQGKFNAGRKLR